MGYENKIEAYREFLKKLRLLGQVVRIDYLKKNTLEITGESLTVNFNDVSYENEIDLSSFKADGEIIFSEIASFARSSDRKSRQFVISMFDRKINQCFNIFQFLSRGGMSELIVFMRSCDVIKKLPNDLKLFKLILAYYCAFTNTHPTTITVHFGSAHVYLEGEKWRN